MSNVTCTVNISIEDMKALVRIRNYFGEHDKSQLEHMAYDVLDRVVGTFAKENSEEFVRAKQLSVGEFNPTAEQQQNKQYE